LKQSGVKKAFFGRPFAFPVPQTVFTTESQRTQRKKVCGIQGSPSGLVTEAYDAAIKGMVFSVPSVPLW